MFLFEINVNNYSKHKPITDTGFS
ncbi:protein of unknown function [Enterobacter cancerogenus]|nr:protein of unknown function [Enterobacter cancerogenus]